MLDDKEEWVLVSRNPQATPRVKGGVFMVSSGRLVDLYGEAWEELLIKSGRWQVLKRGERSVVESFGRLFGTMHYTTYFLDVHGFGGGEDDG